MERQYMLKPALLGVVHAITDACTVTAIMRTTHLGDVSPQAAFALVLGYDVVAFGSQVIFGWLSDRFATPRRTLLLGMALTAFSLVACPFNSMITLVFAGVGNALAHLGAGSTVLRCGLERAAPSGVFVAPGALGLAFGMFYGAQPQRGPVWPLLLLAIGAFFTVALARRWLEGVAAAPTNMATRNATLSHANIALALLLLSIVVRSLVGMSAARGYARSELLVLGIPAAAFFGKFLGGFVADRAGWLETGVLALLLSLPLIVLAPPVAWLLCGLLLFQMTMPVTLTAVARLMPNRLATAFGWTCLALIAGALPTMLPAGQALCMRPVLGVWIVVGTLCLYGGLRLLGIQSRIVSRIAATS
jgi:MFS transporter, FSR family, fosmidomycin resistance protein